MLDEIMKRLEQLGDEKTKTKYIKEGCDLKLYGVKIGDLKKLVKETKINHNNSLACELIETFNYDAMYLGFLIMQPSMIDSMLFIKWSDYSSYFRIRINSLAYAISEHKDFESIIEIIKGKDDDIHQSIYYAAIAGRLIINPTYNNDEMIKIAKKVPNLITSDKFADYPYTKTEMNSLVGYVGMQIIGASVLMIDTYNEYSSQLDIKLANQEKFINSCIRTNNIGRKRKKARC